MEHQHDSLTFQAFKLWADEHTASVTKQFTELRGDVRETQRLQRLTNGKVLTLEAVVAQMKRHINVLFRRTDPVNPDAPPPGQSALKARTKWASVGAVLAGVLVEVGKAVYAYYIQSGGQ
jgi:hypothetical protein